MGSNSKQLTKSSYSAIASSLTATSTTAVQSRDNVNHSNSYKAGGLVGAAQRKAVTTNKKPQLAKSVLQRSGRGAYADEDDNIVPSHDCKEIIKGK